jgi:5'-nucleotidase
MRSIRLLLAAVLTACLLVPLAAQQPASPRYRILVSDDDGVRAPGMAAVAQALQALGEVIIVAPADNQSGKGHSITISEPIFRDDIDLPNGLKAIGLTATPVSTMKVALYNIVMPRPDLVVTGINRGLNLGFDTYLSGTAGGAREAAMQGIPAIATSIAETGYPRDLAAAAEQVVAVARRAMQYGMPRYSFLNVSLPAMPEGGYKGYQVTTQASVRGGEETFPELKHPQTGRIYYWNTYKEGATGPAGTDVWAVGQGYVSVTPMKVGETDPAQLEALKRWFR